MVAKNHGAVATIGIINATPGAVNTIPSRAEFTIDLRHPSDDAIATIEAEFKDRAKVIAEDGSERGCTLQWETTRDQSAVVFNAVAIACVRTSAQGSVDVTEVMDIQSGAGHDR